MKKIFVVLLAFVTLFAFTACNTEKVNQPEETKAVSEKQDTTGADTQEKVEMDSFMKFDPPIELSIIKTADTFFGYTEEQTPSDNVVYKMFEDIAGIKIVNKIECASTAYDQKIKLAIQSNDLPDMIASAPEDFAQMIKNDMLVNLTPYIDGMMTDDLVDVYSAFEGKLLDPVSVGDAVYGLPSTSNVEGNLRTLWIRKDWLEAVGREVPTTMEEVLSLAEAFAKEDPDGNGKDDTWGLPIGKEMFKDHTLNTMEIISNAFGYYPNRIVFNEAGELTLGSMNSGMKDILSVFRKFYAEGVLDPEFTSKDWMQVDEDVAAGKYGLWPGVFWKPVDPGFSQTYKEGVEWIQAPIPKSETVDAYKPYVAFPVTGGYYGINANYEHPEALLVMLNYFNTINREPTADFAVEWRRISNEYSGIPLNNWSPVQLQDPLFFDSSPLKRALADPDFDRDNPAYQVHGQAYDILSGFAEADDVTVRQFTDIFMNSVGEMEKYNSNDFVFDAYFGAPTETQKKQNAILEQKEAETFIQIIVGSKPVEYYDEFIEEYMKLGGSAILEEISEKLK